MELSFVPPPSAESAPDERCRQGASARPRLVEIAIPADLARFGRRLRLSSLGDPRDPPLLVLGGISADRFPAVRDDGAPGWWSGLVGHGRAIDPRGRHVIGFDFAADESGVCAPSTVDQASILAAGLDAIGLAGRVTIVGASYGGMVALALAQVRPDLVERLVLVSAPAEPHPASTAARELQRRVVALGLASGRGEEGLAIARGMAMTTYRTADEFAERFDGGIGQDDPLCPSAPGSYLRARGLAFRKVMSPERFLSLSASIDRHRVAPERVAVPCLVIGADTDQLVPPGQLRDLAARLAGPSQLQLLDSLFGHDMFLKETDRIGALVAPFVDGAA
ncbi:alpha/beta fold hydrolase [Sphingomonas sp. ASV193]|uniref:alpha/beta fold hydrolase n=1 Tax=Sphingomonas sp. ASV193 TaxID=3144405 RepID=UPI0032E936B3